MQSPRFACLSFFLFILLFLTSPSQGNETVILKIIVNTIDKGVFFSQITDKRDFLIRMEDLQSMGLKVRQESVHEFEGELYVKLSTLKGIGFSYDEKTLTLEITALPSYFEKTVVDLRQPRRSKVYYPREDSLFLNYALGYTSDFSSSRTIDLTNQLGIRHRDLLFLSDSTYSKSLDNNQFVRLMSSITKDDRSNLRRVILGDFFGSTRGLGSTLNLGGISLQKVFLMDPHFIQYPTKNVFGGVTFPTKMEIYLDGTLVKQDELPPGEYDLRNLSTRNGAGLVEVVLTDPFGKEDRLIFPTYLSTTLLQKGLHEYTYNLGFLREGYGTSSFNYGHWVASGFHRSGINDQLTIELSGEAHHDLFHIGSSASHQINELGLLTFSVAQSWDKDNQVGLMAKTGFQFQSRKLHLFFDLAEFGRSYTSTSIENSRNHKRYEALIGMGFSTKNLGSITTNYTVLNYYDDVSRQVFGIGYTRHIFNNLSILGRYRWTNGSELTNEIFLGLTYIPSRNITVTTQTIHSGGQNIETLQVQKTVPIGAGAGGRILYEDNGSRDTFESFVQVNDQHGIYTGRYRTFGDDRLLQVSTSGSIITAGGALGFSRPVRDSFAVVQIDDIEGVTVYQNGQEIGKTDSSGRAFVTDLSSFFDNQININDREIPIEYSIPNVSLTISPPHRSGSLVQFEAEKLQAFFGKLGYKKEDGYEPIEFALIRITVKGDVFLFQTGRGGEFYIENLKPGLYRAVTDNLKKPCSFDIIIPRGEDVLVDLGEQICETTP